MTKETNSLKYVCPYCTSHPILEHSNHSWKCPICNKRWGIRDNFPCFLDNDFFWSDIPNDLLERLFNEVEEQGWQSSALLDIRNRFPNVYDIIRHPSRGAWIYHLDNIEFNKALDIGSGFGGLTRQLSYFYKTVYSLEPTLKRLGVARALSEHLGIKNIKYTAGSMFDLPFPNYSFDLITLNGVLEWAAYGGPHRDPVTAQKVILKRAYELLKPHGVLYIGIENRFAYHYLVGQREHTRVRWAGVLPYSLGRILDRAINGSWRHTLVHSRRAFLKMLRQQGFSHIDILIPIPSYSLPRVLVPIRDIDAMVWYISTQMNTMSKGGIGLIKRMIQKHITNFPVLWKIGKNHIFSYIYLAYKRGSSFA
jgi:SAM-dependent methyltransferase